MKLLWKKLLPFRLASYDWIALNLFIQMSKDLCFVIGGWMEASVAGGNYNLNEGEGIIFEPSERHRINKGEGWMISVSSLDYDSLNTQWE